MSKEKPKTKPPVPNTEAETENEPNVAFVGKPETDKKDKDKIFRENSPLETINVPGRSIALPSPDDQIKAGAKGFYHDDATQIKRAAPHLYKSPKPKATETDAGTE